MRRYVHVGTGNYNRLTARIYTDVGLFTSRAEFGHDASELFNFLTGFSKKTRYKRLAVAPFALHDRLIALIDREAEKARQGKPAAILAKLNALVDPSVIKALYAASQAGVPIDLSSAASAACGPGCRRLGRHPGVFGRRPLPGAQPRFLVRRRG